MKKALWLLSLLVLTVSLTACGGSSGSSDSTPAASSGLTGAVVAGPIDGANVVANIEGVDTVIGVSKKGTIVFDKAAVATIKTFPIVVKTTAGTNSNTQDAFGLELRAIMNDATNPVYVTPLSTLAAAIYEKKLENVAVVTAELEKEFAAAAKAEVKAIAKDTFGATIDPFANPLAALEKHELLTQSFLATIAVEEAPRTGVLVATDQPAFANAIDDVATSLNDGGTYAQAAKAANAALVDGETIAKFLNDNKVAIANRVASTITVVTDKDIEDGTKAAAIAKTQGELNIADATVEHKVVALSLGGISPYFKATGADIPVLVSPVGNVADGSAPVGFAAANKYQITAASDISKLEVNGAPAALNTPYDFVHAVNVDRTADEDATVTFTVSIVADDKIENTATIVIKKADTLIPTKVENTATVKLLPFTDGGKVVSKIAKGATVAIADDTLKAAVTYDAQVNTTDNVAFALLNAAFKVRFTAPEGLMFKKAGEDDSQSIVIEATDPAVASVGTYAVAGGGYSLITTKELPAGAVTFGMEVISAEATPKVLMSTRPSYKVVASDDTKNILQSIAFSEKAVEVTKDYSAAIALGAEANNVVFYGKTWNSVAGVNAPVQGFDKDNAAANLTWAAAKVDGVTFGAQPIAPAAAAEYLYGMQKFTVDLSALTVEAPALNAGEYVKVTIKPSIADSEFAVAVTDTTGGVKAIQAKPAAPGDIASITINGGSAAATATGANGASVAASGTVTVAINLAMAPADNAAYIAELNKKANWNVVLNSPVTAATDAVELTSVTAAARVDDTHYTAVLTFEDTTINAADTGETTAKVTFDGSVESVVVMTVTNTADAPPAPNAAAGVAVTTKGEATEASGANAAVTTAPVVKVTVVKSAATATAVGNKDHWSLVKTGGAATAENATVSAVVVDDAPGDGYNVTITAQSADDATFTIAVGDHQADPAMYKVIYNDGTNPAQEAADALQVNDNDA
ncbi:hypothetical protein [Halodesulfovibrio spirochaetisodalis]|uniref:Uncharacterized protein n=1 Tax=Halodesulfovibrio spirochaetisodalis TaxID=1560234 RepID=A0A1B7XPU4_9BACT|nr:hypothetical protein [Halodesulfovibrio spirochaetisodalis]OBQ57537.1 hypothetical protein SP90_00365 [Halodesulfovibrio spirochaetisodalis]